MAEHPPPAQRFTKTDVSKYENTWAQLPHEVSRGAQKNFTLFMSDLASQPIKPDAAYFQRLIAKAILWKRTERLVSDQKFGGYRANLVAYAIAKLSHATSQRLDLLRIWEAQALAPEVEDALVDLSHRAWDVLVHGAPSGMNITEWAKREACWKKMRDERWPTPAQLEAHFVVLRGDPTVGSGMTASEQDAPAVAACLDIGAEGWFALANWAKETANLAPWQRKLAFDIGRRISGGRPPSIRQAQYGERMLEEVRRLGWSGMLGSDGDPSTAG